jgi:hypothetical protein
MSEWAGDLLRRAGYIRAVKQISPVLNWNFKLCDMATGKEFEGGVDLFGSRYCR